MIVDLQTRTWIDPAQLGPEMAERLRRQPIEDWGQLDASPEAHARAMRCVDVAVVHGFACDRLDASVPNEFIADFVARDPDHRLGIASVDPLNSACLSQFDDAMAMGLAGLSVSPALQGFHPTNSAAMRLFERCCEAQAPVYIGMSDPMIASAQLEFARPALWDEVARTFPQLRIVIGQLGHPWIEETLVLVAKHENMFADLSGVISRPWQLYNALLSAVSQQVMDKLLLASGFPLESPAKAIESLYSVNTFSQGTQMPSIPRAMTHSIVERESLAYLGLDLAATPSPLNRASATGESSPAPAPAQPPPGGLPDDDDSDGSDTSSGAPIAEKL